MWSRPSGGSSRRRMALAAWPGTGQEHGGDHERTVEKSMEIAVLVAPWTVLAASMRSFGIAIGDLMRANPD